MSRRRGRQAPGPELLFTGAESLSPGFTRIRSHSLACAAISVDVTGRDRGLCRAWLSDQGAGWPLSMSGKPPQWDGSTCSLLDL